MVLFLFAKAKSAKISANLVLCNVQIDLLGDSGLAAYWKWNILVSIL